MSQVSYGPNLKVGEGDGVLNFLILSFKAWFWSSLVTNMNLHVHAQQASFLNNTFIKGPVEQLLCLLYHLVERKGIRQFYFMFLKCSSKQICITDYWCPSALLQCVHQPESYIWATCLSLIDPGRTIEYPFHTQFYWSCCDLKECHRNYWYWCQAQWWASRTAI